MSRGVIVGWFPVRVATESLVSSRAWIRDGQRHGLFAVAHIHANAVGLVANAHRRAVERAREPRVGSALAVERYDRRAHVGPRPQELSEAPVERRARASMRPARALTVSCHATGMLTISPRVATTASSSTRRRDGALLGGCDMRV